MRGLVLALAAVSGALAVGNPAAAQYYPQSQPYGYGGYGYNGYGYGDFGQVRALQARIDRIEYQIRMLDRRGLVRDDRADRLKDEAERLEDRVHRAARYGLNPYEASDIQARLARLESRVRYASIHRYDWYGRGYGRNGYYDYDRDRDHRYDRDDDDGD